MGAPSLSVVIPVYNSAGMLRQLTQRLERVLVEMGGEYELILVNDGSRDSSGEVVRALETENEWVRGVELMRNYGQHNALLAGIFAARNEVVITMDDDLQNAPEDLPRLVAKLEEGFDVVYGTPREMAHSFWRNAASRLTKLALQSAMGVEAASSVSAFRAFRLVVRDAFADYKSAFVSIDVLLTWGTSRFASIEVENHPRAEGDSNYGFWKLCTHALNMLTGFSNLPLQIASISGFVFMLFGFGVLMWALGSYFVYGREVPGFAFLASVIGVLSGVQLFALGVIGEYIARMHFRLMGRPAYVIRPREEGGGE